MTDEVVEKEVSLLSVAHTVSTGLEAFTTKKEELQKLVKESSGLIADAGLKAISDARKRLKFARVEIEKQGKGMRDIIAPISKTILEKERELVMVITPEENRLQAIETAIEQEMERQRTEKARAESERIRLRIEQLTAVGMQFNGLTYSVGTVTVDSALVKSATDEDFADLVVKAAAAHQSEVDRMEAEKKRIRLNIERAGELAKFGFDSEGVDLGELTEEEYIIERDARKAQYEEAQRLQKEEAVRLEKQKADQDAKAKELETQQEELRAERTRMHEQKMATRTAMLTSIGMERQHSLFVAFNISRRADDLLGMSDEDFTKTIDTLTPAITEARIADQKAKAEAEEMAKAEQVRQKREAAERAEALRPDKDKLMELAYSIRAISVPKLSDQAAKAVAKEIEREIEILASRADAMIFRLK